MTTTKLITDLKVELIGFDSNAYIIIGKVTKALKKHGYEHLAKRFNAEIAGVKNYVEFLNTVQKYVEVI